MRRRRAPIRPNLPPEPAGGRSPGALSPGNPRLKHLRALVRDHSARLAAGSFVLEGVKIVTEALNSGTKLEAVYIEDGRGADPQRLARMATEAAIPVHRVVAGALRGVLGTVTPQAVAAVASIPVAVLDDLAGADLVLVLVELADPGNVGTLLRTAHAAGAAGVICTAGTADPFAPKCVRASAGTVLRMPIVAGADAVEALRWCGQAGLNRLGTVPAGGRPYDRIDLGRPTAVVLGSEARGLPAGLTDSATGRIDETVTIPMADGNESLNVAMVGAVICFEAQRQRRSTTIPRDA